MTKPDVQVNFRMPANLRDMLRTAADANNRTLTAEITMRLEQSFHESSAGDIEALEHVMQKRFAEFEKQLDILKELAAKKSNTKK